MSTARIAAVVAGLMVVALLAGSFLNRGIGGIGGSNDPAKTPPDPTIARVERVTDGDTIRVRFVSGARRRLRYIGIDTPELRPEPQCFGRAAKKANAALVAGERVRIVFDTERHDRYGRLLAYVYRVRDRKFVNEALVAAGYARVLTIPPNVKHADEFRTLAREAESVRTGLWGACRRR